MTTRNPLAASMITNALARAGFDAETLTVTQSTAYDVRVDATDEIARKVGMLLCDNGYAIAPYTGYVFVCRR